jgi:hypothetical protein
VVHVRNVALCGFLVLAVNGCGASSSSTDASDPSPTPDETQQATDALADTLASNSTGTVGFTPGQARCVSEGFVEQFGVEGLQDMGLITEDLKRGSPSGGFDMSPVNASAAADATLACVNASDFIQNLMGEGDMDPATAKCVSDGLGDDGVHDVLVGAYAGESEQVQAALMPAMVTCLMG